MTKRYVGKGEDLRVMKTKKAIKDAAIALMKDDPAKEPSAKRIIEIAQVNKSTFYYHYESVQDLLDQIEQEFFDDVIVRMKPDLDDLVNNPARFLRRFGSFVYEDPSVAFVHSRRLKTTVFDAVLVSLSEDDSFSISPSVIEVILLGLWGYTCRVNQEEYERSIPTLSAFLGRRTKEKASQ